MSAEHELFGLLAESFAVAAEKCEKLAWDRRRGFIYVSFRQDLKTIEKTAEEIFWIRQDFRWLKIGRMIGDTHERAGHWLRNSPTKDMRKIADQRFKKLAECLRMFAYEAEAMRVRAVGTLGMILPTVREGPHRDTRPVSVRTPSGIILPETIH